MDMAAVFAIAIVLSELLFTESSRWIIKVKRLIDIVFTKIMIKTIAVTFVDNIIPFFIIGKSFPAAFEDYTMGG